MDINMSPAQDRIKACALRAGLLTTAGYPVVKLAPGNAPRVPQRPPPPVPGFPAAGITCSYVHSNTARSTHGFHTLHLLSCMASIPPRWLCLLRPAPLELYELQHDMQHTVNVAKSCGLHCVDVA
jgi:hypothetical protein